jgi:hypothetical protein
MEDRETPRLRKYGESKTTQIMMETVPHLTACAGRTKYHADGFLSDRVYHVQLAFCDEITGSCICLSRDLYMSHEFVSITNNIADTHTNTCDMHTSRQKHIHDPVISSQDESYTWYISIFFFFFLLFTYLIYVY